jgi:hypothetical protein
MTSMGTAKASDFTVIPAGTYRVRIASVKPTEPHPEYGPGLEWTFDLIDPEDAELAAELRDAGERFTARTGLVAGPNSKARKWVESVIRRPLDEEAGEEASDGMVVGQIVDALVTNKPNQKGVTRHYVETLVPVKKARKTPEPQPVEDAGEEEPFD